MVHWCIAARARRHSRSRSRFKDVCILLIFESIFFKCAHLFSAPAPLGRLGTLHAIGALISRVDGSTGAALESLRDFLEKSEKFPEVIDLDFIRSTLPGSMKGYACISGAKAGQKAAHAH